MQIGYARVSKQHDQDTAAQLRALKESMRREIHEGLQVIESWNSANDFILYGKGGEFTSNRIDEQELQMLGLHLLQVSLVYINTLMMGLPQP